MEIAIVLGLLVITIVLFSLDIIPVDVVTLLVLITLVLTGILTTQEAFMGFSDEIIVILASIFIISGALREAGVLDVAAETLTKLAGKRPKVLLPAVMGMSAVFSAFMNNTTVTAMFTGPIVGAARKLKLSPSKLLMPLAHASIFGGTCTLLGTSTNIAVSGFIASRGLEPVGLFEISGIGILVVCIGMLFMLVVGKRLLPDRKDDSLTTDYGIRSYLSEIIVRPNSPLIGQRSYESDLSILGFQILKIIRGEEEFSPSSREEIHEGDVILVAGQVENLMKVQRIEGIDIRPSMDFGDPDLQVGDLKIAEVLIVPGSDLEGLTLRDAEFRRQYGLIVIALYRGGQTLHTKIGDVRLRAGDLLLVQGSKQQFARLRHNRDLSVLTEIEAAEDRSRAGWIVMGVFISAIILSSLGVLPLSISMLLAALAVVLTRCLSPEQAYAAVEWKLLILIGGMTAFGRAMENAGAAEFLANWLTAIFQPYGATAVLGSFILLTILLTQPMSNAAAALVVLPVALTTAAQMGLNERSFAIAIMLGASISVLTPFEPSCLIVFGPGKYRFFDFIKVGGLITLLLGAVVLFLVPVFWPL
jgi:di/tricarboxylate transporter